MPLHVADHLMHVFDIGRSQIGFLRSKNCHDPASGLMPDGFPAAIVFLSDRLGFVRVEPRLDLTGGHRDRIFPVIPDRIDIVRFICHESIIAVMMHGNKGSFKLRGLILTFTNRVEPESQFP